MSWRERHLHAIHELEDAASRVMLGALDQILDEVQANFAAVTAAAGDDPDAPGQPPAEPTASLDDLAKIRAQWAAAVDGTVAPWFGEVFEAGGIGAVEQIAEVTSRDVPSIRPDLMNEAAARHLATARNRLLTVGEQTWERTRASLLEGFRAGEGIDPLRRRVQEATDLSRAAAEVIARTEVISAANGGSMARVRLMGDDAPPYKQWLATGDGRTRPAHAAADNQVVARDERFEVGAARLDYPGDPTGPGAEVVNCRCTVLFVDEPGPLEALGRGQGGITEEVAPLVAAASEEHAGAMIALVPEQAALDKLALPAGEPADELHVTLWFLGEAAAIPPELRTAIVAEARDRAANHLTLMEGHAFAASVFNPGGDEPCVVLGVGGVPLQQAQVEMHGAVDEARTAAGERDPQSWMMPEQHAPWVPHITLAYTDDPSDLIGEAISRCGPVMFDRVRVAFGDEVHDLPLGHDVELPDGSVIHAAASKEDQAMPDDPTTPSRDAAYDGPVKPGKGGKCPPGFHPMDDGCVPNEDMKDHAAMPEGECPPGQHPVDGRCVPMDDEEMAAALQPQPGEHFHTIMHTQGVSTGMRTFLNLGWRTPPFAYHWQRSSSAHGGMPEVFQVGLIDRVIKVGEVLHAFGHLDLDGDMGREHARRLVAGFDRWVSIGLDEQPSDVQVVWPEDTDDENPFGQPEQIIFDGGRVGELTAVSVPAQDEATVEPTPELVELMTGNHDEEDQPMVVTAAVSGSTDLPVADREAAWDGTGAMNRVWAAANDGQDTAMVAKAFLYRDPDADPKTKAAWKLGYADMVGGQMQIVPRGVAAAAGGRGVNSASIPEEDKARIRSKICTLYGKVRAKHDDWPDCPFNGSPDADDEAGVFADAIQAIAAAAHRIEIPELPPRWWFDEPTDVELESALNVTDEGRIYGALAPLGVGHRAFVNSGRRQEVPFGNVDYARFMGAWALTDRGRIAAGPVTMDCGHASRWRADHDVAPAHYENACSIVGKIRVGESRERGVVWVAGALEPSVSIDEVSRMLACRLSGDWQPHPDKSGWQELVAALLVPSPGFPMAHQGAAARVSGEGVLVASSVPVHAAGRPEHRHALRVDVGARRVERIEA